MGITFDTRRIKLATFKLEGESQIWWDWAKVSRDLEMMTWGEFRELFMRKFFLAFARHVKSREFLELRQGGRTVLKYVAKFTELARFGDDYVAIDMTKVRKFETSTFFTRSVICVRESVGTRVVGLRSHISCIS